MKSLEILENIKDYLMRYIDNLETTLSDLRNNGIDNYSINHVKDEIALTMNTFTQSNKIKQDLEVLEIIKKKKVEVLHLWYIIKTNEEKDNEYILMKYNESFGNQRYELTLEELLKLKQWLEVNENE